MCDSVFVSAHGLKCLLGVFITRSDLQHDSYFMSHLAQASKRKSWQSLSPLVSGGEEEGASNKLTTSQAKHSCVYLNMEGDSERGGGNKGVPFTDKHTRRLMVFGPVDKKHQQSDPTVWTVSSESNLSVAPRGSLGAYIIWPAAGQTLLASITFSTLRNRLNPCSLWIA